MSAFRARPHAAFLHTVSRYKRYLLAGALVLGAGVFAVLGIFYSVAGNHRVQLQQELHRLLGKDVNFERLETSLWGGLGFSAKGFRIDDDRRFAATPFVQAKELRLGISFWELVRGHLVIDSLTLTEPEFQIITNEDGAVNVAVLARRKKNLSSFPKISAAIPEKRGVGMNFAIGAIHVSDGRLHFIDRSVAGTPELQVKNFELHATELDRAKPTRLKFAAALTEGLDHDVLVEGTLGPPSQDYDWSQRSVDLEMRFDSLQIPMLAGALPALKQAVPRELDVTGPMTLHARLVGTLRQPTLIDVTLKVPLFGSSDYNAILQGSVNIPENRNWAKSELRGNLTLKSVALAKFLTLPGFKDAFPERLAVAGLMNFTSRFEGSWDNLRIGARFDAAASDIRYGEWLLKPTGRTLEWMGQLTRRNDGLRLHNSSLRLGDLQTAAAGFIETEPSRRLELKLYNPKSDASGLGQLLASLSGYDVSGSASWNLTLNKSIDAQGTPWSARGTLNVAGVRIGAEPKRKSIEQLNAAVVFSGIQARVEGASLRYGPAQVYLTAILADLREPRAIYEARTAEIGVVDTVPLLSNPSNRLRDVVSRGEFQVQNSVPTLTASVNSSGGVLENIPYQDLRAELVWSPAGTSIKQLSLRALDGVIEGDGVWGPNGVPAHNFNWSSKFKAVDVAGLLKQKFPKLKNRFSGELELRGQFSGASPAAGTGAKALAGSGDALISNGLIKDFNLVTQLFVRGNRSLSSPRLAPGLATLVNRTDTPFDTFKGSFKLDPQRLSTDNLLLTTPDYTITGAGWVALDRTTRWNGLLVLSPALTQELLKEYKILRYFIDRRGQLSIAFKVDGTLPNVRIRPENHALAQAFRWGSGPRGSGSPGGAQSKPSGEWVPKTLDQFLER